MEKKLKRKQVAIRILIFLFGYVGILYLLKLFGIIVFVNRLTIFQQFIGNLGSSIYFFSGNLIFFIIVWLKLSISLSKESPDYMEVKYWLLLMTMSISLFFGIGVIYTAVGMQRAFMVALGDISQDVATSMGPWGILQKLVDGGLLMALLTTIVGSALGYLTRVFKLIFFGKKLICLKEEYDRKYFDEMNRTLSSIDNKIIGLANKAG